MRDRFDDVPVKGKGSGRVGAHRLVARPRHTLQWMMAMLLAIVVLTALGIFLLSRVGADRVVPDSLGGRSPEASRTVTAELDPDATVAIINGTNTDGLGESVSNSVTEQSWGNPVFVGPANDIPVAISAVFYTEPEREGAAKALGQHLGGLSTYQNPAYGDLGVDLVVVIGQDYMGPGREQAAAFAPRE